MKLSTHSKGFIRNGVQGATAARSSSRTVQVQTLAALAQISLFGSLWSNWVDNQRRQAGSIHHSSQTHTYSASAT